MLYPAGKPDTRYEIPDGTTVIGYNAFEKCTLLTEIVIPDSVREIQDNAFRACEGLTAMDIPEGVTALGEWAFDTCMKLERLSLPSTLTNIPKNNIFEFCYALREITVAEGNSNYCAEDGVLFTGDRTRLIV